MITIKNCIVPFIGFKAMTIWPFVFVRDDVRYNAIDKAHEEIHGRQQIEVSAVCMAVLFLCGMEWWSLLGLIMFYPIYFFEWVVKLPFYQNAYRNISFEREAYGNQYDDGYLRHRKLFSFIKYLF